MVNEQQNNLQNTEEDESFNLMDFCNVLLSNWYWIAASIAIALGIAVFVTMRTVPTYTRSCSLLIKDEKKGQGGVASISSEFEGLGGLLQSNTNINNEIITISAPVLMQEVVKRLHLDVELTTKESLHQVPLYDKSPVSLLLPQAESNDVASFKMKLNKNKTAELWDFKTLKNGEIVETDKKLVVTMNTLAHTPAGVVIIQPTKYWGSHYTEEEITVTKSRAKAVAASFSSRLGVALNTKESTVLDITLTDASKRRADDVINKLIEVYNEQWLKDKNRVAESTFDFITDRLNTLSKELGDVDQKISDYRSQTLLPDDKSMSKMYIEESTRNSEQILTLNNQLSVARYIRDYMADHSKVDQYLPSNTGIGSTGIEQMIGNYNKSLGARNDVLENSSEASPLVQKLNQDLALQRNAIMHSLDNLISQLSSQMKNWESAEQQTNEKIATAPRQAKQLLTIGRQQQVKEALYLYLLQKREENELSKTFTAWNTRIVQPPMGSDAPSSPRKSMFMLIALAAGFCIPAGLLFLRENLDHTVRGRADLEGVNTQLLGEIPAIRSARLHRISTDNSDRIVQVKENSRDLINEAFRIIRTKLGYFINSSGKEDKVIMLTSFNPNSGKTFIAMNLAKVMALKNKRVIVVDLDLRKASLSKLIHSPHHGISGYLSGFDDDISNSIVKEAIGTNVDMLPVGIVPPNPSEILQTDRLEALFNELRKQYDVILVDCPPVDVVADANIIAHVVDITIFIVRAGLMDRKALRDIDQLAKEGTYKRMALMLNGTRYVSTRYGNYRYGYSYGYGYGYGYHTKKGGVKNKGKRKFFGLS